MFVDGGGQLDVSRVQSAGSQLFACVGVDAVGNSARTRIRVTSVDPDPGEGMMAQLTTKVDLLPPLPSPLSLSPGEEEVKLNPKEWYFILGYSVGAVLVVGGLAVVLTACWLTRDQCCERVARKIPTRTRVRRSRVKLGECHVTVMWR